MASASRSFIFRQMLHYGSCTYTYLLGCNATRRAILIDPVLECAERDLKLLHELNLNLEYTLNTHMHADHIRNCSTLKEMLPASNNNQIEIQSIDGCDTSNADIHIKNNDVIQCGNLSLVALHTPGHTEDCHCFLYTDKESGQGYVFTGDALFVRGCGRTDFQGGSSKNLYNSIMTQLYTLNDDTFVYPGHDYNGMLMTTIKEEKEYNPRIKEGTKCEDFQEIMANLNLRPPKNLEYNVSENLKSG